MDYLRFEGQVGNDALVSIKLSICELDNIFYNKFLNSGNKPFHCFMIKLGHSYPQWCYFQFTIFSDWGSKLVESSPTFFSEFQSFIKSGKTVAKSVFPETANRRDQVPLRSSWNAWRRSFIASSFSEGQFSSTPSQLFLPVLILRYSSASIPMLTVCFCRGFWLINKTTVSTWIILP